MREAIVRSPMVRRLARRITGTTQLSQLVRLAPVVELVEQTGGGELLDVGSGSVGIARWLGPEWTVTAVDSSFDDYGAASGPASYAAETVIGDVRALPFGDRAFDVVVALDLLEHVEPADRGRALEELVRVSRHRVIVACPAGPAAFEADRRLAGELPSPPGWLDEHVANGLPDPDVLARVLGSHGRLGRGGNENVERHRRLVKAELSLPLFLPTRLAALVVAALFRRRPAGRRRARQLLARLGGDSTPPHYRVVFSLDISA